MPTAGWRWPGATWTGGLRGGGWDRGLLAEEEWVRHGSELRRKGREMRRRRAYRM
jgi:hypothetical protein